MADSVSSSRFVGFVTPGTTQPFTFSDKTLGYNTGFWQDPEPDSSQAFEDFLQQVIAGVTGLPGNLVRPRWQKDTPNIPPIDTTWAAIGLTMTDPAPYPAVIEQSTPNGDGSAKVLDQEEFDVMCSFIGPMAEKYAIRVRAGLFLGQNREALSLAGVVFVGTTGRAQNPELIRMQWRDQIDITLHMRRMIRLFYPILYFLSAPFTENTDTGYSTSRTAIKSG